MSRDDGFLSRWSKRKVEAQRAPAQAPASAAPAAADPAFDLASLPSLDSLTGASDITMFLQKGVPESLRNAALRKAWASDPAIRDYIGPADYQWDFQTPGAICGFGELTPGTDVARLVADVTEYHLKPGEPAAAAPLPSPDQVAATTGESPPSMVLTEAPAKEPAAPAAPALPPADPRPQRRRHGGATPR